jgi:uncharacterized protein (DUF111 family)
MSKNISYQGAFIKGYVHADVSVTNTAAEFLPTAPAGTRRVALVVQNTSATATVQAIFAKTGTVGIRIPPLGSITQENYNGPVRLIASAAAQVHLAYANS